MATPYEMDLLGSYARTTSGYIGMRVSLEDLKNNEDWQKALYIEKTVLGSGLDDYLDYEYTIRALTKLREKYKALPTHASLRIAERRKQAKAS